jgi:hypothetical protein
MQWSEEDRSGHKRGSLAPRQILICLPRSPNRPLSVIETLDFQPAYLLTRNKTNLFESQTTNG